MRDSISVSSTKIWREDDQVISVARNATNMIMYAVSSSALCHVYRHCHHCVSVLLSLSLSLLLCVLPPLIVRSIWRVSVVTIILCMCVIRYQHGHCRFGTHTHMAMAVTLTTMDALMAITHTTPTPTPAHPHPHTDTHIRTQQCPLRGHNKLPMRRRVYVSFSQPLSCH